MKNRIPVFLFTFLFAQLAAHAEVPDTLTVKGQLSAWGLYNGNNTLPLWGGGRYLPQVNYEIDLPEDRMIDFEGSANMYGNAGTHLFDTASRTGKVKPYRLWARYSTRQLELRAGLQKINFGSATLLRPLMWFDQIDPRDPLRITDVVWGILGRYYFLNNANVWVWALYGNENPRGWEPTRTRSRTPELGGRLQYPVPRGEAGITYHYRVADSRNLQETNLQYAVISENRIGFDVKFDMVVGWWVEGSWVHKSKEIGLFTNQEIINLGVDYTFGLGNGLTVVFEQLVAGYDETPFEFRQSSTFTLVNTSYSIGLFDTISVIVYFDWTHNKAYNFINWQKQFNKFSLYFMGFANPKNYDIPSQGAGQNLFAGNGVQVMVVYNH